jgi:hypothetical protein
VEHNGFAMTDAEYIRLRSQLHAWKWVAVPGIITAIVWAFQYQGYPAGDWRGDVVARAVFSTAMIAWFVGLRIYMARRLRAAERERNEGPR